MDKGSLEFQQDFIKQIGLGINISRTYPKGHPSLLPVIQRLKILLKEIPIEKESVSIVIIEDVIMIEEERFDSKRLPIVKSLVDRFNQLAIKSITFNVDLSDNDLKEFFAAMAATPADITDYGDITQLIKAKGIINIKVNKFRVGVIASDQEVRELNWEDFLKSFVIEEPDMSEEDRVKQLGSFLAGIGIVGSEPVNVQTDKIAAGLEKLALTIADQYGDDRWSEYSIIFSRLLSFLSPTIKKNVVKYRTENKKLAVLFRGLIPTMPDEDIVEIIAAKAKEKTPHTEQDVVDILKNITGSRLPDVLSSLRVNVPELDFEKIVARLMGELETTKGAKEADKFLTKNIEMEMRHFFPKLRDPLSEERIKAIESLTGFESKLFEAKDNDLIRLLVDRFDTMADAETEVNVFTKVIDALKSLFRKASEFKMEEIIQFISKKFSKHLIRKEVAFLTRKKVIIKAISDIKDQNYVPEMVSLLWDPGTFVEAREALISLSEYATPLLIETLKDADDRSIRMKIIDIIIRIGKKAVPEVLKLLSATEWYIRRNGIFMLKELGATNVISDIGRLVEDEDERVQLEAIECLNKIGNEKGKEYIKKALGSKYKGVVLMAMRNLDKEDVKTKIPEVTQWLKYRKTIPDEKEEKFRCDVINLLATVGDDSVINTLIGVLNERALFKGDLLYPTKESALNALLKMGSEKAMQTLHEATNYRDQFVAGTAREILKRIEARH